MDVPDSPSSVSRRAALAGSAAALTATAGCVQRLRNITGSGRSRQLTVEIKTLPGDSDPFAAPIARHFIDGLEAAGIDYRHTLVPENELYRQVLLGHDFDVYIAPFPYVRQPDPDVLYPLLHSMFRGELGWQNPFGFSNLECNDLLSEQRQMTGESRREAVESLQQLLGRTQPFVPLVMPDVLTGARSDRFSGWDRATQQMPHGLLALDRQDDTDETLRLTTSDDRITENRNPISATHSQAGSLLELLYDPLVVDTGSEQIPWLADEIDVSSTETDSSTTVTTTVSLRENLTWHDGDTLTVEDVVFTYRFLADTALGEAANPIPAPRFRGATTLVESVESLDSRTVQFTVESASETVVEQLLTVPIFPAHIWDEQSETVSVAGIEIDGSTTEALVWNNPEPVGSGPLQFESATVGESVRFSRFDDHFLTALTEPLGDGLSAPPFTDLVVEINSSGTTVVEVLVAGEVDATLSPIAPARVERIERESALSLFDARSYASYHLGFNTRREPFGDPNFRQTVGRLFDKQWIAAEIFDGYGEPISSPLAATDWLAADFVFDGDDPATPFLGADGDVDATAARNAFRDLGYQYNDADELIQ